jgi:hypothetical protein
MPCIPVLSIYNSAYSLVEKATAENYYSQVSYMKNVHNPLSKAVSTNDFTTALAQPVTV